MFKLVIVYVKYLVLTICVSSVIDVLTSKDEAICSLLLKPEGVDDIIIDEYKSVTKLFGELEVGVRDRNETVLKWAETIMGRGEPRFLNLQFSLGRLKLHYNWGHRESNFFEFLTLNARFKWQDFEAEYKNYTIELKS